MKDISCLQLQNRVYWGDVVRNCGLAPGFHLSHTDTVLDKLSSQTCSSLALPCLLVASAPTWSR